MVGSGRSPFFRKLEVPQLLRRFNFLAGKDAALPVAAHPRRGRYRCPTLFPERPPGARGQSPASARDDGV